MAPVSRDTIVALSTGRLPSGIAVVRISGSRTRALVEKMFGLVPGPRRATYGQIRKTTGEKIDSGLLLFFPAPRSFTGEDCAEFHVHGGKAVVSALLDALTSFSDVRHAEAGEFTQRAFLNGKLDLPETEALADLIASETEAQRRLAIMNAGGAQSELYANWRQRLIQARAMIEAELDFADEADVPGSVSDSVWADVSVLVAEIASHIAGYHRAEIVRDGFDVVIAGAPNAGKSSLLNALAQRDAAIVSDEPGTTRDLVELALDLKGVKIRLTDTAGIREGAGKVEALGIERSLGRVQHADLVLLLVDSSEKGAPEPEISGGEVLRIGSKADATINRDGFDLLVSAKTGSGIGELLDQIANRAVQAVGNIGDILPFRLRHIQHLKDAQARLENSLRALPLELRAEELRLAADDLGRIVGEVDVEDLLDVVFSQFCIGK